MPHGIVQKFKTELPAYVVIALGKLQVFAIQYAQAKVTEILQKLLQQCPPQEELKKLTDTVNTTRTVIAQVNRKLDDISKIASYLDPVLIGAQVYIEFQKHRIDFIANPITGPAGSQTLAKTSGKINSMASRLRRFEDLVDTVEEAQFAIKASVTATKGVFIPIETALSLIDSLIERCALSKEISDEDRSNLIKEITSTTDQLYVRGIPYRSRSGKTYTIKVTQDRTSSDIAPKRQAIAQDFRGITILTGPSSFASNPQVLVEELKFRIENQLP